MLVFSRRSLTTTSAFNFQSFSTKSDIFQKHQIEKLNYKQNVRCICALCAVIATNEMKFILKQNYKRKYCVKRTQNAVAVYNLNRDFSLKLTVK